ncbi:RNA polymerase III RPC4-domain-containing protein [Halteromyces radiatus]|uniref:RNA polymerase III RPC4-domain-containing protein n=1 Tax=Halteromyces radiatus TaxID=101107 RepID=UPI00221F12A9|nr:RNA polymerase III RPC4-domain-containing protein [Halteromyces radiatus]KAI8093130.1 RNA polymerase III RPC4-domain-containing protein [Halteromyces radiatus]
MSNPPDNTSSTVKKQTRRFAPTIRGRGRGTSRSSESTPSSSEPTPESSTTKPMDSEPTTQIGHMRPEASSEGRLSSVHGQKTRGGAAKMKFKPTIPTKRNKKEVSAIDEPTKTELETRDSFRGQRGGRGDGRGRGRGGRGRGRGRGRGLIVEEVTASGIFSLGPSAMSTRARSGMTGSSGAFATYGGDSSRQEQDNGAETDMSILFANAHDGYTPVVFPHVPRLAGELDPADLTNPKGKIPWLTTTTKSEDKESTDTKEEKKEDDQATKVKLEPTTEEDAMKIDSPLEQHEGKEETKVEQQPIVQESTATTTTQEKWMMDDDAPAQNIFAVNEKSQVVSVADDELLFFQLPGIVPSFTLPLEDEQMTDIKTDDDKPNKGKEKEQLPVAAQMATLKEKMANMDLADMPDGQIGKLMVYKSGKMKLKIGNILLDVDQGMRSSFLENLMSVNTENKKAVELGHIVQKFTCIPNMDALLEGEENK